MMPVDTENHTCPDIPLFAQITRLRFLRVHAVLGSLGIHPGQYHLLALVAHAGGMSQSELATQLYIKPSTLTVMVGRLMKADLVHRSRDPNDKRILRIYLTERGSAVIAEAISRFTRIEEETFAGFTDEEMAQFTTFATRIRNNLLKAAESEGAPCPWF
jgi:DNA-binding MarR family transcriptional regulator